MYRTTSQILGYAPYGAGKYHLNRKSTMFVLNPNHNFECHIKTVVYVCNITYLNAERAYYRGQTECSSCRKQKKPVDYIMLRAQINSDDNIYLNYNLYVPPRNTNRAYVGHLESRLITRSVSIYGFCLTTR